MGGMVAVGWLLVLNVMVVHQCPSKLEEGLVGVPEVAVVGVRGVPQVRD